MCYSSHGKDFFSFSPLRRGRIHFAPSQCFNRRCTSSIPRTLTFGCHAPLYGVRRHSQHLRYFLMRQFGMLLLQEGNTFGGRPMGQTTTKAFHSPTNPTCLLPPVPSFHLRQTLRPPALRIDHALTGQEVEGVALGVVETTAKASFLMVSHQPNPAVLDPAQAGRAEHIHAKGARDAHAAEEDGEGDKALPFAGGGGGGRGSLRYAGQAQSPPFMRPKGAGSSVVEGRERRASLRLSASARASRSTVSFRSSPACPLTHLKLARGRASAVV